MKKPYSAVSVRNLVFGEGLPKICVPLTPSCDKERISRLEKICSSPHDLIEWRVDFWEMPELIPGGTSRPDFSEAPLRSILSSIRKQIGDTPLLFTFRTKPEGGERSIRLQEYRDLVLAAAHSGMVDLIDLEYHLGEEFLRPLISAVQEAGVKVVGSCHDYQGTPSAEEITGTLCRIQALGADISKIAVMPQSRDDVLTLMKASIQMEEELADRPFITMSMGKLGGITRLAGTFTGSAVTFATAGAASAPGQMEAAKVQETLKLLH